LKFWAGRPVKMKEIRTTKKKGFIIVLVLMLIIKRIRPDLVTAMASSDCKKFILSEPAYPEKKDFIGAGENDELAQNCWVENHGEANIYFP
jgi:hypothetical protein